MQSNMGTTVAQVATVIASLLDKTLIGGQDLGGSPGHFYVPDLWWKGGLERSGNGEYMVSSSNT